ncbi:MAG: Hsp20 family protein [Allorhizobium sp.]|jgi:HSP20 family molecular chaperone IbpA
MTRTRLPTEAFLITFDTGDGSALRRPRGSDGYPPYDIERLPSQKGVERLRVTLAVAGFDENELDVSVEANQLVIRGKQAEREEADYLFRGIASRQFQRVFAIEDGMEVMGASLRNGLLAIEIIRHDPVHLVRKINISTAE